MNKQKTIQILQQIVGQKWILGVTNTSLSDIVKGKTPTYYWINNPYKDRWFADPFILEVTDTHFMILCEEFCFSTAKGRIALLSVERMSMKIVSMDIVLEEPTHLSFPLIIRRNGKVFVQPENGASGEHKQYILDLQSKKLVYESTILKESLADAVPLVLDDELLIFATKPPLFNGPRLYVYHLSKNGTTCDEIEVLDRSLSSARMAGQFFRVDGVLYRPVQDCKKCYGHKVVLQKVCRKEGQWHFEDTCVLSAKYPSIEQGFHTFNVHESGWVAVDKRVFMHPVLALLFSPIKNLFLKLLG